MMPSFGGSVARAAQGWVRWFASTTGGAWLFARVLPRIDRVAFRLTGGRRTVTSTLSGLRVIMLTTTGARTGMARTVPVMAFTIGGDIAIAAGNFGRPQDPGWCLNLRRDPHAQIVVDGALRHVVAEELTGGAREEAWQIGLQVYPGASAYAKRAGARTIGVFLLHPDNP
jgi:deazaflavin-dependent oxidoreductase (nitroreductase family)